MNKLKVDSEEEEIGYWRKINWLHSWIVFNCANGKDECQTIKISEEELKRLLTVIDIVLNKKDEETAMDLLPTASGFFFGDTEIGEWYWDSLEETKGIIEKALKETDFKQEEIIYQASW